MMEATAVPRLRPGMKLREDTTRDRWVVLGPERMFIPDETALEVLRLVDGARSLDGIIDALAAQFDAPRAEIAADVQGLLEDLAEKGVVTA
jgi:pyrroloquinoline quinone biosynthesis protein D